MKKTVNSTATPSADIRPTSTVDGGTAAGKLLTDISLTPEDHASAISFHRAKLTTAEAEGRWALALYHSRRLAHHRDTLELMHVTGKSQANGLDVYDSQLDEGC
jgi:hypothetical protein